MAQGLKRGRPPIGRKAMTAAERQARWRKRLLQEAEAARQQPERRADQPPYGYERAKAQLLTEGRHFERARREFGFEEGVFVDGAFLGTPTVIRLAELPPQERQRLLAEGRRDGKNFACNAVRGYMEALQVSLDELIAYFEGDMLPTKKAAMPLAGYVRAKAVEAVAC
jgi:hypothetical protein